MLLHTVSLLLHLGEPFDHSAFLDDYTMGEEIGEGGFGKVYKAIHKVTGTAVAVKYINVSDYLTQADQIEEIYRETNALSSLDH